jgi:PAS domain S-box-containing protein
MFYMDLIFNLSFLVALSVVSVFIEKRWSRKTRTGVLLQGFLFGSMAIIGMLNPLVLEPGLIFDGRSVILSLCALFFGPLAISVACVMTIACRVLLGGAGMFMGVSVILASSLIGLWAHYRFRPSVQTPSLLRLYALGLAVHLTMVALMFTLPGDLAMATFKRLGLLVILLYPLATILIGKILSDQVDAWGRVKALQDSEERYRIAFHTQQDAININRVDNGKYILVNEGFTNITGYTEAEIIGKTSLEMSIWANPTDRDRMLEILNRNGKVDNLEAVFRKKDGNLINGLLSVSLIIHDGVAHIFCVTKDITGRKQNEEALRLSEKNLRGSQRIAHLGSWHLDLATNQVVWTEELYKMYGFDPSLPPPPYMEHMKLFTPESWEILSASLARTRETGIPYELELETVRKDGSHGWMWVRGEAIKDSAGNTTGLWGAAQDITERKQAEAEREKLLTQLTHAQKMESVGRLAGGVAHDFNNMLGVILGHAEMAMDKLDPSQPLYRDLQEIRKAAERSADLTRQLLAFARKQTIAPKVLDLNDTVEGMLKMLRRLIGEDIDLAWMPGANLWPVKMDPSQIDQILVNLCVNARDAIKGVGKITIETQDITFDEAYCAVHTDFIPGEYVLLAVSDDGCGMDKETQSHLFEPFFTTKGMGQGTGLGLATVYGIVRQNNGFINVYSEPGHGTRFAIYLPRHAELKVSLTEQAPARETKHGSETILLVEDEPTILRMTEMMLERLGYKVLSADRPGKAMSLAREYSGRIDLLMTDVVMPGMNGRDLAANLLSIYPDIKCLFMSGYTANVIAHHGVLEEGVQFIQKPFSLKDLSEKLRETLASD